MPLPTPLAPGEAALVRRVYDLQKSGAFDQAAREAALLGPQNPLLGHLRADRLLRQGKRAPSADLQAWLAAYADHPEAPAVHALLLRIKPQAPSTPPQIPMLAPESTTNASPEDVDQPDGIPTASPALRFNLLNLVRSGKLPAAQAALRHAKYLPPAAQAELGAAMARSLFTAGDDTNALEVASTAYSQDRTQSQPAYLAGLASWRQNNITTARGWFQAAAQAPRTTPAMHAAAAFWTARAAQKQRDPRAAQAWLAIAAQDRHSFYGLLAGRLLGRPIGFDWDSEVLGDADVQAIAATAPGQRGLALLQVGQPAQAEAEFRALWPTLQGQPAMQRALMMVAHQAQLTALAAQLAGLVQASDGRENDLARFPVPQLRPARGFTVDQPLVYALARIESNFENGLVSPAGARGLLQMTPTAASFVSNGKIATGAALQNPALNLDVGQRYLIYLSSAATINQDLVRVLAAYNAGLGAISRWNVQDHGDPLLYIESIPTDETRHFVPRALAYSWIYAARFHQSSPSLDALAAGSWPRFTAPTLH